MDIVKDGFELRYVRLISNWFDIQSAINVSKIYPRLKKSARVDQIRNKRAKKYPYSRRNNKQPRLEISMRSAEY